MVDATAEQPPQPVPTDVPWAWVLAAGALAGFASGLFGVGGGIVIVPVLTLLARFPHKLATGTSLTAIVPISAAALVGYATEGELDLTAAALLTAGSLAGAVAGTRWLRTLSGPTLRWIFAALMFVTAVQLALGDDGEGAGRGQLTVTAVVALIALGFAAGVLAGLLGVGGGIILVPALTLLFGLPLVVAKGSALAVILPTSVLGTLRNRSAGLTALRPAAVVGAGGVLSAFLASKLALGLDPRLSTLLFAGLLGVVALRLALSARCEAAARPPGEP
ncbi:MAG: sulfite exporter TauE/SafE family protein [Iamia sp.]